jgi:hypothetical protein
MDFKAYFNPIVSIFRLLFSLAFAGLACFIIYLFFKDTSSHGNPYFAGKLLCIAVSGILFLVFFKALLSSAKTFRITGQHIQQFNYFTFSSTTIDKNEIKGFSTSETRYRLGNFRQVIIYLKNGKKINLMQFSYFNFRNIQPALIENGYNYFGYEPYKWKWFNNRVYKYE